jgi:DNA (cytosine-5)-methyltransferase 1
MSSHMRYASVCDGIGAAHVAWRPLGWECAWTSEIEPFPAAVVDHHWKLKNLGDMTKLTEEMLNECGAIDLLVGGTPCQSFSVAGLRKGLDDPRGNLALRFVQLVGVLRPSWVVWENVPGVLSSGGGTDFGTFLGALAELGYGFAYRVLDAQWFGVAQRRRRVFVVAHLGNWRRAAAVLFERESLCGNPPTRGKAGEGVARTTAASPSVCGPLTAGMCKGVRGTETIESHHAVVAFHHNAQAAQLPHAGRDTSVTDSLTCSQGAAVAFTKSKRAQSTTDDESWVPGEVSPTMSCFDQGDTRATTVVAFDTYNHTAGDVSQTLQRGTGTDQIGAVMESHAVRRLTPLECERLQGFPDGYTDVTYRGKPASDGPRYKALGNSMAVPVMAWIGKRIAMLMEATDGTANG